MLLREISELGVSSVGVRRIVKVGGGNDAVEELEMVFDSTNIDTDTERLAVRESVG